MARKKVAKTTKIKKNTVKKTSQSAATSSYDKIEKEFLATPAKLMTQTRKELSGLKQQEKKLKAELKKAQAQKKVAKNKRVAITAKAKQTAAQKKQITALKQAHDKISNAITTLSTQHNAIKSQVKQAAEKCAYFAGLQKTLSQFEKQWALKTKKAAKPAKTAKKSAKKIKQKTPHIETMNQSHALETEHASEELAELDA